ncbi:MAG TPA: hypothetical protein VFQ61_14605 [Polyangiaceae bacterium]|nr:hypothetical protein [Polyangiaceae bacterium]
MRQERVAALDRKYAAALGRARRLQQEGKVEEARKAFITAAGEGEDVYHRAIGELAFLEFKHAMGSDQEVEDTLWVAAASEDPVVAGQAFFNLAALYARQGKAEPERAALARSLARNPSVAAEKKLGRRSRCAVEVGSGPDADAKVVTGWAGVCQALDRCDAKQPLDEAHARARSCVTTTARAGEPEEVHGCTEEPPWDSTYNYSLYRYWHGIIQPLPSHQYWVYRAGEGGWSSVCSGDQRSTASLVQGVLWLHYTSTSSQVGRDRMAPQAGGVCWDAPEDNTHTFYSKTTGKKLATIRVLSQDEVQVEVSPDGRSVRLGGAHCSGRVPLDGSNRLLADR